MRRKKKSRDKFSFSNRFAFDLIADGLRQKRLRAAFSFFSANPKEFRLCRERYKESDRNLFFCFIMHDSKPLNYLAQLQFAFNF
jgi:hypothetical protein